LLGVFPYGSYEVFNTDSGLHYATGDAAFLSGNDFLTSMVLYPHLAADFQNTSLKIGGIVLRRQFLKHIALLDVDLGSRTVRILAQSEIAK
jgi:hypothetical protein